MRRVLGIVVLFAVIAFGIGFAWWRNNTPLPVNVASIERNVEARLFGIGTVEAQINTRIGFQIAGPA